MPSGGDVQLNDFGTLSTAGIATFLVPTAVLAVPSLLIVLIVLIQAGFATAWIPVTRRVLGNSRRRRTVKPAG